MAVAPVGDDDAGIPGGWGLALDRRTRRPRSDILVGGFPTKVVRLTAGGTRLVDRCAEGQGLPASPNARRVARILTDRGIAHPVPTADGFPSVSVIIPVRDQAAGVAVTLNGLASEVPVIVVDDGSIDPGAVRDAAGARATVLRHDRSRGPGAARNSGWRHAGGDLIAFVDAHVEIGGAWLADLAGHFADPTVGAVAPRITSVAGDGTPRWLAAYEAFRSPLDLGADPAPVRPRSTVPYVPTAALIVRRQALATLGGFDESLITGEDVDLIWRLVATGWRVRYDPSVIVTHPTRTGLTSWARQRVGYGRSAAPLERRHGSAVAPLVVSPWTAAALGLGLVDPLAGMAVGAAAVATLAARLDHRLPRGVVTRLAVTGQAHAAAATATAVRRAWWPVAAIVAAVVPRTRRPLAAAVAVPPLVAWVKARPALDPALWSLLYVADDLFYGAGVWAGMVRTQRFGALRPVLVRSPKPLPDA